jgi:hypothetical protein
VQIFYPTFTKYPLNWIATISAPPLPPPLVSAGSVHSARLRLSRPLWSPHAAHGPSISILSRSHFFLSGAGGGVEGAASRLMSPPPGAD